LTAISTSTEPKPAKPGLRKARLIEAGLRRLDLNRKPGQTFSQHEIARRISEVETPVSRRAIQIIERKALYNLTRRLNSECPGLLQELLGESTVAEILATSSPSKFSPHRTKATRRAKFNSWTGGLTETANTIRARRPKGCATLDFNLSTRNELEFIREIRSSAFSGHRIDSVQQAEI
jgi:hypothetical protein